MDDQFILEFSKVNAIEGGTYQLNWNKLKKMAFARDLKKITAKGYGRCLGLNLIVNAGLSDLSVENALKGRDVEYD